MDELRAQVHVIEKHLGLDRRLRLTADASAGTIHAFCGEYRGTNLARTRLIAPALVG